MCSDEKGLVCMLLTYSPKCPMKSVLGERFLSYMLSETQNFHEKFLASGANVRERMARRAAGPGV